jgi:transposase InsO family protein
VIVWIGVTAHPSAEWIARQLTEAYAWAQAPQYVIRDFIRRLRAMGIRDQPIAPRSPWQNGHTERLIGPIRRECLDHVVVFGEQHLRQLLGSYQRYYNDAHAPIVESRMHPRRVRFRRLAALRPSRTSGVCTIITSGFDFR